MTSKIGFVSNYLEKPQIALLEVFVRKESTEMGSIGISVPLPAENMVQYEEIC